MAKKVSTIRFKPRAFNRINRREYEEGITEEIQSELNKGFEIKGVGCDDTTCIIILERDE